SSPEPSCVPLPTLTVFLPFLPLPRHLSAASTATDGPRVEIPPVESVLRYPCVAIGPSVHGRSRTDRTQRRLSCRPAAVTNDRRGDPSRLRAQTVSSRASA